MLLEYGNTVTNDEWVIDEKIPPGYSRVYYVYSGEVLYADDFIEQTLKPGFLYVFPSAVCYRMSQNLANKLHCTFLHIDVTPSFLTELTELSVEDNPLLKNLLNTFAASIEAKDLKVIHALADVFELYCLEHRLFQSPTEPISFVLNYIAEHLDKAISIATLSQLAGYNEQYFIRLFQKTVGLSPYQYLIGQRLKEAKKLIKTGLSVTTVAAKTGFGDVKSFSRTFRKNCGYSPTEYRTVYGVRP